jgi:hypothetical protein
MRDWIREASEGVMWIVPGAELLEDIVMSFDFVLFFFGRGLCVLADLDGYGVLFLVLLPFLVLFGHNSGAVFFNMSISLFQVFEKVKSHLVKAI